MIKKLFIFLIVAGYGAFVCYLFAVPRQGQSERREPPAPKEEAPPKEETRKEEPKKETPSVAEKPKEPPPVPPKEDALPPNEATPPAGLTPETGQELFRQSIERFQEKRYDEAIAGFQKIFAQFPTTDLGHSAAYNVACACALKGDKTNAIAWLKKAIDAGYKDFDHMRNDEDLSSLRRDRRYQQLLKNR